MFLFPKKITTSNDLTIDADPTRQLLDLKKLIEKSRECHDHKPQPTPDTKRKKKKTKINACKINKQMLEDHIDQLSLPQARCDHSANINRTGKKHENKCQGKTNHETLRRKIHKATLVNKERKNIRCVDIRCGCVDTRCGYCSPTDPL